MSNDIEFKCGACGGESFICDNDPPLPEDVISCKTCEKPIGTLEDITKKILEASGTSTLSQLKELRAATFDK